MPNSYDKYHQHWRKSSIYSVTNSLLAESKDFAKNVSANSQYNKVECIRQENEKEAIFQQCR